MPTQKKIALITGANRGIGFETAKGLAKKGFHVLIGSRDEVKGARAVKELAKLDLTAESIVLDVTNEEDHQNAFDWIQKKFGHLDVLVNNAGVWLDTANASGKKPNHTSTTQMKMIRDTFDSNFFGVVALTQILLPLIRKSEAGRIVNLSSVLGSLTLHADPKSGIFESKEFAYNASKSALNAFTIHLAHELKDTKIKVNSAHPGWVKTDMGGSSAPMELPDGAKTSIDLATLSDEGPNGGFFHAGEKIPW